MAYGSSEQGGDGTDVSLADLVDLLSGSPTPGQRVRTPFVSAPAIGKLQKVMGSVTITRANVIVAQPAVGDLVYEGDLIETGIDGLVAIVFVDGTTFRLYDSAHMVLDEFVFSAERSANSALFRVLKGRFSFLSGMVAATGRLIIDTAVARIQNTRPAAGIGGLAFSVFTIGLIHELNAASADIALLDDGTITCKDLKHGVFEIVTKGDHPQRYIVDDPCVSIHFQIVGSQVRVSEVANTPGQMALFHDAFLSTLDSFLRGQQDPLIQKWQHAEHAAIDLHRRQLDSLNELNNVTLLVNENGGTLSTGHGTTNTTTTTTTTTTVAFACRHYRRRHRTSSYGLPVPLALGKRRRTGISARCRRCRTPSKSTCRPARPAPLTGLPSTNPHRRWPVGRARRSSRHRLARMARSLSQTRPST